MTENVVYMENNTREGRSWSTKKEVVGCVHSLMGKEKLTFQFEDGQNREMGYFFLYIYVLKRMLATR